MLILNMVCLTVVWLQIPRRRTWTTFGLDDDDGDDDDQSDDGEIHAAMLMILE
jgi:hypothetical protein